MKKMIALLILLLLIPCLAATTIKIYPIKDVYTDSSSPISNFNTESLRVGNDFNFGKHRTYFQFNLSSIHGEVSQARLSIDPVAPVGVPNLQLYYVSSDSWSENAVTWDNAPSYSTLIDSELANSPDRINFDVFSAINESDKVLSLAIKSEQEATGNIYVQFFSSEFSQGSTYWPYLEVTYSGGACNTDADTDCNGCVTLLEIVNLMSQYKQGQTALSLLEMVSLMGRYKAGEITC